MPDLHPALLPFVKALHASGRPQVWSIVVTIFGDAVLHRGGRIAMQDLQSLTAPMNISEGALRTAISRLASEGWLIGERHGRNSFYSLSSEARVETVEASKEVYRSRQFHPPKNWSLGIGGTEAPKTALQINKTTWLWGTSTSLQPPDMLVVQGRAEQIPNWLIDTVIPQKRATQINSLLSLLNTKTPDLAPQDALILRVLVIHFWRRIVLGLGPNVFEIAPPNWPLADCHSAVASAYRALFDTAENALCTLPRSTSPERF